MDQESRIKNLDISTLRVEKNPKDENLVVSHSNPSNTYTNNTTTSIHKNLHI